jgi:hypothetical protein
MHIYHQSSFTLQLHETEGTTSKIISSGRPCFYPKNNWRTRSSKSLKSHHLSSPYILFFCLDDFFNIEFQNKILPFAHDGISTKDINNFTSNILSTIPFINFKEYRAIDINITPPSQNSTAYNHQLEEYLGLHIDTHDGIANEKRANAWSLIAINLGREERYLNFVNVDFNGMCNQLDASLGNNFNRSKIRMPQLVKLFFSTFPDSLIFRVTIPPNHGYIACTQNFIHDGSTNKNGINDINLLISGDFTINTLNSDFLECKL